MEEKRRLPERRPAVTLADVAKLAGVSEITVSRIMRNKGPIADHTREKVMTIVRAVGYVPNRVAGSLASSGSNLMGVIIPSLSNIVFPEVLRGIQAALDESGFQPVVGVTNYSMEAEETLVRSMLAWKPSAMIITGFEHTQATRRMLQQSGIRIAELMDIDSTPIDIAVGMSHQSAGYEAGKHLISRGYRNFGYVGHDWSKDRRARLRYDGLAKALSEAGLLIADEAIVDGPSSTLSGRTMMAELISRSPDIDVVVFSNDDMAVGGVFHCIAANLKLKDDIAVFGFNGLEIGQSLPVPLSTIRSNRFRIGRISVEKIIESPDRSAGPIIIDTGYEIVAGGTA